MRAAVVRRTRVLGRVEIDGVVSVEVGVRIVGGGNGLRPPQYDVRRGERGRRDAQRLDRLEQRRIVGEDALVLQGIELVGNDGHAAGDAVGGAAEGGVRPGVERPLGRPVHLARTQAKDPQAERSERVAGDHRGVAGLSGQGVVALHHHFRAHVWLRIADHHRELLRGSVELRVDVGVVQIGGPVLAADVAAARGGHGAQVHAGSLTTR
jgi:hypothetical protein